MILIINMEHSPCQTLLGTRDSKMHNLQFLPQVTWNTLFISFLEAFPPFPFSKITIKMVILYSILSHCHLINFLYNISKTQVFHLYQCSLICFPHTQVVCFSSTILVPHLKVLHCFPSVCHFLQTQGKLRD